ncbi:Uncharacterised protein [Mammaliicoccus stepanovicii]|uniref:Uncharacterized protein n=1 Tax=Mammaliicoccus stepanovicii TaxID=643214 RepID=A0A239Z085_9STAP|nr:Uncharacterised protein [Mammaliicoccus stepanovicii]
MRPERALLKLIRIITRKVMRDQDRKQRQDNNQKK